MDYQIDNKKTTENFVKVPKECFLIKNNYSAFYLYVWLCSHKDEFKMNEYFIKKGTGMDYRTFRKNLLILENLNIVKLSKPTNSNVTNSKPTNSKGTISNLTIICIVDLLINKNNINKNKKTRINKQEETSMPPTGDNDVVSSSQTSVFLPTSVFMEIPIGKELTEEERKEISDSLPF